MIRCTFAGHRDVCGVQAEDITEVLEEIIQYTESPIECFVGGMGKFDNLCAAAVRLLKRQYREKEISLILVLPYLQKRINVNSAYYESMFDLVLIPSILEGVHYKHAIVLRNRWMVEQADYVIAMVRNIAVCQKEKEEDYQFSGTQKITPVGYQTGVKISLSVHHEFL